MNRIQFVVAEAPEGGLIARAIDASIFTAADDMKHLRQQIADAAQCHFDEGKAPQQIILC